MAVWLEIITQGATGGPLAGFGAADWAARRRTQNPSIPGAEPKAFARGRGQPNRVSQSVPLALAAAGSADNFVSGQGVDSRAAGHGSLHYMIQVAAEGCAAASVTGRDVNRAICKGSQSGLRTMTRMTRLGTSRSFASSSRTYLS